MSPEVRHSFFSHFHRRPKQASPPAPELEDEDAPFNLEDPDFRMPSPLPWTVEEHANAPDVEEREEVAELIALYGSSSATSWLEPSRYSIWRGSSDITPSTFRPVQGYMRSDPFVFAWGNPIVSDPSALEATCYEFWLWCNNNGLKLVWCCVDNEVADVLGKNPRFCWSTLSCIVEDTIDPSAVVELARSSGGGEDLKDFKKNLRRAERNNVSVREVKWNAWSLERKSEVEQGIHSWKKAKSKGGIQLASSSFQPWVDAKHRRYWTAEQEGQIVGILILTRIQSDQYQIKNAVSFPDAPRGTSEYLIYQVMNTLHAELQQNGHGHFASDADAGGVSRAHSDSCLPTPRRSASCERTASPSPSSSSLTPPHSAPSHQDSSVESATSRSGGIRLPPGAVTFGISASETITPVDNLRGWRITWLAKVYNNVVGATGLTKRGDFRNKFRATHLQMYVCFPAKQGLGTEGVKKLMKCLRQ